MADPTYEGQARVYRKQGATGFVVASGGEITVEAGGEINASAGSIVLPGNLRRGFIPLDIFSARVLASGENFFGMVINTTGAEMGTSVGGVLNAGSVPALNTFTTAAMAARIYWTSGQQQAVAFPPIPIPPDFSSAGGLTIHAMANRSSDGASNNVLDMRFWANLNSTEKGTTGSTLATGGPGEVSITVSSAEAGAHPGVWNVQIVPGTHTNNKVSVFSAWVEYNRASS